APGRPAAAPAGGSPGILHGARSMMLQDRDGQVVECVSPSAGRDYPGVGPQIAALAAAGRLELSAATDDDAFEAMRWLARTEGILPALETAHALPAVPRVPAGTGGGGPRSASCSSGSRAGATRTLRRSDDGSSGRARDGDRGGAADRRHELRH